ncbi:hypothetical protein Droror1_Dr00006856 [Drosera rotundifolia]
MKIGQNQISQTKALIQNTLKVLPNKLKLKQFKKQTPSFNLKALARSFDFSKFLIFSNTSASPPELHTSASLFSSLASLSSPRRASSRRVLLLAQPFFRFPSFNSQAALSSSALLSGGGAFLENG